ncbi:MAG: cytochrome c [Candidatus Acidiferrales bacterium]
MNCFLRQVSREALLAVALLFLFNISTRADDSASVYKAKCAVCHAPDGSGGNAMGKQLGAKDLRSDEVQKHTDAELTDNITNGLGKKMPAYKDKLTADQIKGLVAFIRDLGKKK